MKKRFNGIITALLAAALVLGVFTFAGCGGEKSTKSEKPVFTGTGTEEDPWVLGELKAFVIDGTQLWVEGSGEIPDFDSEADRPWNSGIAELEQISIFGEITRIGKNAFRGAGVNTENFDVFIDEPTEIYGESCFEGAKFSESCLFTFKESVKEIGARAFADSTLKCIYFDGAPETIADDAFGGVTATVNTRNGIWADEAKQGYGGTLSYKLLYAFEQNNIYDDGASGTGTSYCPEGEEIAIDANTDDSYKFVRWELVEGDLEIEDETNSVITFTPTGDIKVNAYFTYVGSAEDSGELIFEESFNEAE